VKKPTTRMATTPEGIELMCNSFRERVDPRMDYPRRRGRPSSRAPPQQLPDWDSRDTHAASGYGSGSSQGPAYRSSEVCTVPAVRTVPTSLYSWMEGGWGEGRRGGGLRHTGTS